ncbi:dipeptide/oligopeptide/nickel ABC transporter ATP-binding protein [Dactylosporangium sp. AC04546]|uniref:ABC transporter ATP-binding protein n=1 Tax=Dactylosporangium sp. AC04546 TaxID=2862460 RepID=UPI001EE030A2|nr:dipeptide/oligopeptide/nickel ABC transporter ATP-binding protein [Dactylosporangium sp. AC04546]WVK80392.1 dipeptide/oligopeptide/nickel ABC transporter ATP-binding protein [Dactylosporangium sp. AC04546]
MTGPTGRAGLAARGVTVAYGRRTVLDRVSLSIAPGETVGLRGPSGCGKSTLVRVLALLHRPDGGHVSLDGTPITGARYRVPPAVRTRIGILFQSPRAAADPRLSLADLIAEPLRALRSPPDTIRDRVTELADTVGLTPDLLRRQPHAVSDGQLQRACLARALVHRPDHLLCDEATTMLDASTQAHVATVIADYQRRRGTGVLVVSHDPALLRRWADRVIDWPPGKRNDAIGGHPDRAATAAETSN